MSTNFEHLVSSLKTQLEENDGELGYWGPVISIKEEAAPPLTTRSKADRLEHLRAEVLGDCQRCALAQTRKKIVFGVGNPDARVMFVGEGPGFDEDRIGDPFVGQAGQLLDKIIQAIGLDRGTAYIANIVKCHPLLDPSKPDARRNDRPPTPEEIETCLPFLRDQIAIIQPMVVVALGATAAQTLLGSSDMIGRLRGKIVPVTLSPGQSPIPVLPTYHPAALLRDESLKRPVWEDMKTLQNLLDGK